MKIKQLLFATGVIGFISIALSTSSSTGCADDYCDQYKWGYSHHEFEQYNIDVELKTPSGIVYDPSGQNISPQLIDRLTSEVESCLNVKIDRTSFKVKIANDWVLSCDKSQQLLPTPVFAGNAGCVAKGLVPDPNCPCRWRAGIRCPNVIVIPPNFYLYKDALIRFVKGIPNPWIDPVLSVCATPSTTPLSDGSDPNNGL